MPCHWDRINDRSSMNHFHFPVVLFATFVFHFSSNELTFIIIKSIFETMCALLSTNNTTFIEMTNRNKFIFFVCKKYTCFHIDQWSNQHSFTFSPKFQVYVFVSLTTSWHCVLKTKKNQIEIKTKMKIKRDRRSTLTE